MKKKILLTLSHLLVAVLATAITLTLTMWAGDSGPTESKLDRLERLILERFIGEVDREAIEDAAANAMVEALGDRWSYYISASEYTAYLEQVENAYVGVGITIQVSEDTDGFQIIEVAPGGPAEEAGIQVGDILIYIEDVSTADMGTTAARDLVRGPEGTYVNLTVSRNGQSISTDVERRKIETPVAQWQMLPGKVGLVAIVNFDLRCAEETITGIEALLDQGAESLIFDLRGNPGGYAYQMVEILDYLLPKGEVFRTVDYLGRENVDYSDEEFLDIPIVVLVNGDSYSAAEFFAQALREYDRAIIVGEKTCGKGYFQTTIELGDGSAVGLSVGKYFTPKGLSLANVGVTPDVEVIVDEETWANIYYGLLPPEEDPQIQAALDILVK